MLELLFPLPCAGCAARTSAGAPLCPACLRALRAAPSLAPPPGVDAWASAFRYSGAAREVVARVKYRNARAAVPWLADHLATAGTTLALGDAVVTWAPTTPEHRRARGFDPAALLARATARRLGRPARRLLTRLPGPPQTGLSAAARARGPRFAARAAVPRAVLVVDDVATTGATIAAAATALRVGGASTVLALTAARTPVPGDTG